MPRLKGLLGGRHDVIVYIDGFNLYYGSLINRQGMKWLDLEALCDRLLPQEQVRQIRYFTARAAATAKDPDIPVRQDIYLRALATLPRVSVHFGQFRTRVARMKLVNPPPPPAPERVEVYKPEEKGSDVNLASFLLRDAVLLKPSTAVIVSNDSDLAAPAMLASADFGLRIGILNPHPKRKRSADLHAHADFSLQVTAAAVAASQLPAVLNDEVGTFRKPANW